MRFAVLLAAVAAGVFRLSAETAVGVVGLDTSHAIAFTKMLNVTRDDPVFEGFRVTAAYTYGSLDIVSSTNRYPAYTAQMKEMGVTIVPSLEELLQQVDVVLLETNDGRRHYEQAEAIFRAGKPVFIDKPIAASLSDTVKIVEAGRKYQARYFSSSALRYVKNAQGARGGTFGKIRGADMFTPAHLEPTHSHWYWYGVHGAEPLFTVMGRGCRTVTALSRENDDAAIGVWEDGRIGILRGMRGKGADYGGFIFSEKGVINMGGYEGYKPLLVEIVKFFKSGVPPVDPEETLEIFAFMEAAAESQKRGGAPVSLAEVLERARR